MIIKTELAKRLKELRKQLNQTQSEVALNLNVPYQTYQSYELGKSVPPLDKLIKLADLYDVSLDYLVGRKEF